MPDRFPYVPRLKRDGTGGVHEYICKNSLSGICQSRPEQYSSLQLSRRCHLPNGYAETVKQTLR